MSVEYTTNPPIKYNYFIGSVNMELIDPPISVYTTKHKVVKHNNSYIYVRENEQGNVVFERFGINNIHNILPKIIKDFNLQVIDEAGLIYPDCLN